MRIRMGTIVFTVGLTAVTTAAAQSPTALAEPMARSDHLFSRVSGLRELPDGRLLVADARERLVHLLDLTRGATRQVGREGAGPREYASAGALFAMPQGRTLMVDSRNQRYLMFSSQGLPEETIPFLRVANGPVSLVFGNPGAVDNLGRLYVAQGAFGGGGLPDSVPLLRVILGATSTDTVGFLRRQVTIPAAPVGGRSGVGVSIAPAWYPQESWGVAPDGMVARVFPAPYQVGWYARAGTMALGPPIPYPPLPVTEADRQAYRDQQATSARPIVTTTGADGRTQTTQLPLPPISFAETKPPFWGAGSVLVSPRSEVWVLRTRPAEDPVPAYDIFDRTGALLRRITIPVRGRVVAFGPEAVYVARADADDLEQILKFRYP